MKKQLLFALLALCSIKIIAQCPWTFVVNSASGFFTICPASSLYLTAYNNSTNNVTYTWAGPSFTSAAVNATIGASGVYTVVATSSVNVCSVTKTITVGTGTLPPGNSISPIGAQNLSSCAIINPSSQTFTGTGTAGTNYQHRWYSPVSPLPYGIPMQTATNVSSLALTVRSPGIYTFTTKDLTNGCEAINTKTITSLNAYPTFNISSPVNFSTTCNPPYQTTISVINAASTQTPQAPLGIGICGVGGTIAVINLASMPCIINVQDLSNFCNTLFTLSITQNTFAPITASNSPSLICQGESATLTAIGANTYIWNPGGLNGTSVAVSPTVTTTYTVSGTSTVTGCTGNTIITQNVSPCTGISNYLSLNNTAIKIFPNPNNGEFTISGETDITLKIINQLGQIIKKISLTEKNNHVLINDVPSGIYFLIGNSERSFVKEKLIVE